jgi:hypothetical protein
VSFRVEEDGWYGGSRDDGDWRDDGRRYDGGWDDWNEHRGDDDNGRRWDGGRTVLHDRFRMGDCSDDYSVGFDLGPTDAVLEIDCVESSNGDPTEIVGRLSMKDNWGDDVLFRLDVEGDHGERPEQGRVFVRQWGDTRVEVEVAGYRIATVKNWQVPRINWIEFEVRVFGS